MRRSVIILFVILSILPCRLYAFDAQSPSEAGIEEKLGQYIPLNEPFIDERGNTITLKEIINKPAIIAPVYYKCSSICPTLLSNLADVLGRMKLLPGKDYVAVSLSFDETDTPELAASKKRNYIKATGKPFPAEAWMFLTGNADSIKKTMDGMGYRYKRSKSDFAHPVTLIITSPEGKIVRYINGSGFLPFELALAVSEASDGRTGGTINRVLQYCFTYDAAKKRYVFNLLKVFGTVSIVFIIAFIFYLTRSGRKRGDK
ncbi:MAG: SCO family protein [Nitrospirae bacterium]|nr:MAG: SCO family protein [Nitrospirota bacterium]